jgi:hypothetical protein
MCIQLPKRISILAYEISKLYVPQIPNKSDVLHIYYPMRPNLENEDTKCPNVTMEEHTTMSNRISTTYLMVPKENKITGHAVYIDHSIVMYIIAGQAMSKLRVEYDLSAPFVVTNALVTKTRLDWLQPMKLL